MKQLERFASVEPDDLILLLSWLVEYTRRTSTKQCCRVLQTTDADVIECHQHAAIQGGVIVAASSLLAGPRSPGSEETWERVKAKFSEEAPPSPKQQR